MWKIASITIILNGKPPELPSPFRPICILSVIRKFFERNKVRLEKELENMKGSQTDRMASGRGGPPPSVIHAVERIIDAAKNYSKKWFVIVGINVIKAFNSATWSLIIRELEGKGVSSYLVNIVQGYFEDRVIRVTNKVTRELTAGVPQGLVPLLCTIWSGSNPLPPERCNQHRVRQRSLIMVDTRNEDELEYSVDESLYRVNYVDERK